MASSAGEPHTSLYSGGLSGHPFWNPLCLTSVMFDVFHGGPSWNPPCLTFMMFKGFHGKLRLGSHGAGRHCVDIFSLLYIFSYESASFPFSI